MILEGFFRLFTGAGVPRGMTGGLGKNIPLAVICYLHYKCLTGLFDFQYIFSEHIQQ